MLFFEKLRIKQGKEKAEKRKTMEVKWRKMGGMPRVNHKGLLIHVDECANEVVVLRIPGESAQLIGLNRVNTVGWSSKRAR